MNDDPILKKLPQVSIGMPVYNGEKFIREALDSLLAQTFTDFELIISDNASMDGTEAICREYAERDQRIRYVRQAENRGPAANFRFVLDEAVGEYFMWAAADDVWTSRFIENCSQMLINDHSAGMAMMAYVATSRLSCIFNRTFDNPLACITLEDARERVKEYSLLSFSTHKDNLVYAVWKKEKLNTVMADLSEIGKPSLIGASMNEYALALFKGLYISEVGFHKRYRYLPPGHILGPIFGLISHIKRKLMKARPSSSACYGVNSHLSDLVAVLNKSGFDADFVAEIVDLNKLHTKRRE